MIYLPLPFPICQVADEYLIEKTFPPLIQSMNRSNFGIPHEMMSFILINHEPLMEKGGYPKGQYLRIWRTL